VNSLLLQYSYLQLLDLMTTMAFLMSGVQEGNPVVRWALNHSPTPASGLLLVKLFAIALGVYCWKYGRHKLLSRINIAFAVVVAWNLLALIAGMTQHA
jgi:hypothetical protein